MREQPAPRRLTEPERLRFQDVARMAERELQHEELLEHAHELRSSRDLAQTRERVKSEFLANMSHEIRTPMNGIIGLTELLLQTPLNAEQQEFLRMVRSSSNALMTILNDILDWSKIEAGKVQLESVSFDLHRLVSDTLKVFAVRAHQQGLELIVDVAMDVPRRVYGDPGRIRQVLTNLVGNALKFTPSGEIYVTLGRAATAGASPAVRFSVKDTGIGVEPSKQALIFEQFSQEESSTTRRYGGTGLGLSISAQLVSLMGGTMELISEKGVGSDFHFALPLLPDLDTPDSLQGLAASLQGRAVLVVDDHPINRQLYARLLAHHGMAVQVAENALQALTLVQQHELDLILIDGQMPGVDGFALAERLNKLSAAARRIPKIMLSSSAVAGDEARSRALGFAAYYFKPIANDDLIVAIQQVLTGVAKAPQQADESTDVPVAGPALRVLLVEDNLVNQRLAEALLSHWGHAVTLAVNGLEAVEQLKQQRFDVVLMDMLMPVMDGLAATRCIRDNERAGQGAAARAHIIAMTANATPEDEALCLEAGMDDYLSKPLKPDALLKRLRALQAGCGWVHGDAPG